MDQQNFETILETLAEKIRDLEFEVSLREYENEKLKKENESLLRENKELKWHLNPLVKGYENMEGNKND